ncbi:MAG: serine/threonine-protein phosphatase [Gammaproteobacteria bacterium]|nr:serine/threonine-protein phosphatase [Gammaproteobacteria bacterium]
MSVPSPTSARRLKWISHGISDTGKVRRHNEDSMLMRPEIGLWAVADGMGGHAKGDVASQMVIESLRKVHEGTSLARYIDDIEDRIVDVNGRLMQKSQESAKKLTIGSTVVIMLAFDKYCVYLWVGDSRLYRLRAGELRQITTDHSQVEMYVEQGLISREEAMVHPHGNMITRAVGAMEELHLDMDMQEMLPGDRYVLCSDGLTKHSSDVELQDFLKEGNTEEVCRKLIDITLSRGAGDNVTTIVVDIE